MYEDRIARLRNLAKREGLAGIILTPGPALRYTTGANLPCGDRLCLAFIPALETEIIAIVPAFETHNWTADVSLPSKVFGWEDTHGPSASVAEALGEGAAGPIGVDPLAFSYRDYALVSRAASHCAIQDAADILAEHRMIKSRGRSGLHSRSCAHRRMCARRRS